MVGSLWSVLDPPTALLMVRLHQGLLASKGVAAALQQAQLWLRNLSWDEAMELLGRVPEDLTSLLSSGMCSARGFLDTGKTVIMRPVPVT